ncbi:MAG: helix-turn-helix domain-containing protein [Oscillospiraceae bacterium]|nr:helix-turn-helix domain-containing protein [Oscillospiraceae bacterium]
MNIYIGQNIKKLRTQCNVTQEKLADYLSVSYQAVSKWERGEAYPDITTLPALARFFNTTTDELLGVDNEKYEAEIQAFLDEHNRLKSLGGERESRDLARNMFEKYPHEFRVMDKYMWGVFYDLDYDYDNHQNLPDWRTIHADELIPLCEEILSDCTDDEIRFSALQLLRMIYTGLKDFATAESYSKRMPKSYSQTYYEQLEDIYSENDQDKNMYYYQFNIVNIVDQLFSKIIFLPYHDCDEKNCIRMFKAIIDLFKAIFDDGNLGLFHWEIARLYEYTTEQQIKLGEYEAALNNLDTAADHYVKYDNVPGGTKYTSVMTNRLTFERDKMYSSFKNGICPYQFQYYTEDKRFDPIRDNPRFQSILQKLK